MNTEPTHEGGTKAYDSALAWRLLGYLRPYRLFVGLSIGLLILSSSAGVVGPYLSQVAVDRYLRPAAGQASLLDPALPEDAALGLRVLALIYLSMLLVRFVSHAIQTRLMHFAGQQAMRDLSLEIFARLQKFGIDHFNRRDAGAVAARATSDVAALNDTFISGVVAAFGDAVILVFIPVLMFLLSPSLTLVMFVVLPFMLAVTIRFCRAARASYRQSRAAIAALDSYLREHIRGMTTVQLHAQEPRSREGFGVISRDYRDAQLRTVRAQAAFLPSVEWLSVLAVGILLLYGGYRIHEGSLTLGVAVAFLQYGAIVYLLLQSLTRKVEGLQAAMASSERIFGLLDTTIDEDWEAREPEQAAAKSQQAGEPASKIATRDSRYASTSARALRIEFEGVWFAYDPEVWVLRDLNLTIEPGETLAIVGHSGAGKTTLIHLLLRFYDVQRGRIRVGDRDIRDWPINGLRRQFGFVPQEPYLFSRTIEQNIRLAEPEISTERVGEVAREANLEDFIGSLPQGYQTVLHERGSSLSWGQQQLLTFARALAHDPPVILLDEASWRVDKQTEAQVCDATLRLLTGHTSVVVANRLSTIKHSDRVAVLHKGEIREIGSDDQLLSQRGIYWRLYELQYREQEPARQA